MKQFVVVMLLAFACSFASSQQGDSNASSRFALENIRLMNEINKLTADETRIKQALEQAIAAEAYARKVNNAEAAALGSKVVSNAKAELTRIQQELARDTAAQKALQVAMAAEKQRLVARDQELSAAIARDGKAMRGLGFGRREAEFEEWKDFAEKAQKEYRDEVSGLLTDLVVEKTQDGLLEGFKHFDAAKGKRWIAFLESLGNPKPVELIAAIRSVSQLESRGRAVYDARHIVDAIDKFNQSLQVKDLKTSLPALLDLVCDTVPRQPINKQCRFFRTEAKWTVAVLYNNAAQRVAASEVERLTEMTETQLQALRKVNEVLVKHVKERNEIRAELKDLE